MIPVPTIEQVDVVFGAIDHLPKYADLPDDYRRMHGPACDAASDLFYAGGRLSRLGYEPRDGVDENSALRAIYAALRSFEPTHEHKIGGVGYLIDQWFHRPVKS